MQSQQHRKKQCKKHLGKWAEDNERLRNVIEDSQAKMEDNGQKIHKESVAEAELDEEIRSLQGGDEYIEAAVHLSPRDGAWIRPFCTVPIMFLQNEFGKTHGAQHQPAPVTPVHVPQVGEAEEQSGESRKWTASARVPQ